MEYNVLFFIAGVPYILPHSAIVSESSNMRVQYDLPGADLTTVTEQVTPAMNIFAKSIPTTPETATVNVRIQLTSGSEFFINKYSIFKSTIEGIVYLQDYKHFPKALKFCTYIGKNEYMEHGQLVDCSFSDNDGSNLFTIDLAMQRNYSTPKTDGQNKQAKSVATQNLVKNQAG